MWHVGAGWRDQQGRWGSGSGGQTWRGLLPLMPRLTLLRGLNREVLLKEDVSVEGRCSEAFAAVRRFEESHKVAAKVGLGLGAGQHLCVEGMG